MFLNSGQIISRDGGDHVSKVRQKKLSVEKEAAMFLRSSQNISRERGGHVP